MIPYLRIENLKNATLSCGTYLYSPYMEVPPPPPPGLYAPESMTNCPLKGCVHLHVQGVLLAELPVIHVF